MNVEQISFERFAQIQEAGSPIVTESAFDVVCATDADGIQSVYISCPLSGDCLSISV